MFSLQCQIHLIWKQNLVVLIPTRLHGVCSAGHDGARTRTSTLRLCCDCVCLVSQADVTKCVVNTDPSFRSHWLVSAMCTFGHYLKSVVLHLLREKWCSSLFGRMFTLLFLHWTSVDQPTATAPLHQKPHRSCQLLSPGFLFIFYCVYSFESEHLFEKDHQALQCAPCSPRAVAAVTDWELFSARTLLCGWATRGNLHEIHELHQQRNKRHFPSSFFSSGIVQTLWAVNTVAFFCDLLDPDFAEVQAAGFFRVTWTPVKQQI